MNPADPTTIEPTGAPKPLEKENIIPSVRAQYSDTGTPDAVEALKMRAPSM
jgi:hypothetical protein